MHNHLLTNFPMTAYVAFQKTLSTVKIRCNIFFLRNLLTFETILTDYSLYIIRLNEVFKLFFLNQRLEHAVECIQKCVSYTLQIVSQITNQLKG